MTTTKSPRRRIGCALLIGAGLLLIVALAAGGVIWQRRITADTTGLPPGWQLVSATQGTLEATVDATGDVEPVTQAQLNFEVHGTVTEVLVKAGDQVTLDQPLARIDTTDLQLGLEKAQADLLQQRADYQALLEGATPQEIAEAQARIARAQSQYQQTASSVTEADIAAARADLERAQARLERLASGPETKDRVEAETAVQRAEATLAEARSQLAAAKERARLDMETAANEVRNRQDEYSQIYWDNREQEQVLRRLNRELPQADKDKEAAALRAIQDAETTLEQRRIAYEEARTAEITTLQQNEASLRDAQAKLDDVLSGSRPEDLADARADVQRAQAKLAELTGARRSSTLAAEQASVTEAQMQLEKLLADPQASEFARAEAAIARAEIAVKEAQRDLERATLTAPFAATVTRVNLHVGERSDTPSGSSSNAAIIIADVQHLQVKVPIDELDIAQVDIEQQVRVILDALPESDVAGTVTDIAPTADKSDQGTTTYEVTVALDAGDAPVRAGMTAVVEIVTLRKEDVVIVPRRAVQSEAGQSFVLLPADGPPPQPNLPASERREVQLGLSDREFVEIVSGLEPGDEVLVQDVVTTFNPFGG